MKKIFVSFLMLTAAFLMNAQDVGKMDIKESAAGQKKMVKAAKKIYISEFSVNYQMAYSQTSIARGGREFGGGYRGDAKASLSVAIPGVSPEELQQITDDVYQQYIQKLEGQGFEIVGADEAGATDIFDGWERLEGGTISQAQFPGYLATTPKGIEYLHQSAFYSTKNKKNQHFFGFRFISTIQTSVFTVVTVLLSKKNSLVKHY